MKLLEQLDVVARRRGMADATIEAYSLWVRQFLTFSARRQGGWRSPRELFTEDVEAFLNDLVVERRLSASSQSQEKVTSTFFRDSSLSPFRHYEFRTKQPARFEGVHDRVADRLTATKFPSHGSSH